jgi:hypothetical protein
MAGKMAKESCTRVESGRQHSKPLKMYYDNETTVFYARNNKSSGAAKHIDIKFYIIKEKI